MILSLIMTNIMFSFIIKVVSYKQKINFNKFSHRLLNQFDRESIIPDRIVKQAITWSGINGLMYTDGNLNWTHAPIALLPQLYPYESYNYLKSIQPLINSLIDQISRDKQFILYHLNNVRKYDDFTNKLLNIYEEIDEDKLKSIVQIGIHRSDYMLNKGQDNTQYPLQIEINTIASSFGCLSKKVGELHKYLLTRNINNDDMKLLCNNVLKDIDYDEITKRLPINTSTGMLAFVLSLGHILFADKSAKVLFVVQPNERNIADQRLLENELWTLHGIAVEFVTLADISKYGSIDENNYLYYHNPIHSNTKSMISVVYYRSGYGPNDYPTQIEWDARRLVELSKAIKCPTIGYQLAGTKKIQQILYDDKYLSKYISDESERFLLKKCFAAQYSLGEDSSEESLQAIESAIADGSNWVLKPQREGGGNNLYGKELSEFLRKYKDDPILSGFILMQRIFPKEQYSLFLRNGELKMLESISELGIYGIYAGDGSDQVVLNREAGYLLRTKPNGVDEGGVATGYSVLNSIVLNGNIPQDDTDFN